MPELRINCPRCGQPFTGDAAIAGLQIRCPACQADFWVPPNPLGVTATASLGSKPAIPPVIAEAEATVVAAPAPISTALPRRTEGMAILAFVLALAAFPVSILTKVVHLPIGLLACIPAVICGHLALGRIRGDRTLSGRGFAIAAVVLGYACISLSLIAGVLLLVYSPRMSQVHFQTVPGRSFAPPNAFASAALSGSNEHKVITDPLAADIPSAAISGTVKGQPFAPTEVKYRNGILTLTQSSGFQEEAAIIIFTFLGEAAPDGKSLIVPATNPGTVPHIHFRSRSGRWRGYRRLRNAAGVRPGGWQNPQRQDLSRTPRARRNEIHGHLQSAARISRELSAAKQTYLRADSKYLATSGQLTTFQKAFR